MFDQAVSKRALLAITVVAGSFGALSQAASANVTLPGLNGKIAFASDRDAPAPPPQAVPTLSATAQDCEGGPDGDDECGFDIFTMSPDGSALVNLTQNQPGENNAKDDKPSWSPDGTKIAFESRRACEAENRAAQVEEGSCHANIFVMNADGSNVVKLTSGVDSDTHPTWSPDGNTIAFERGGGNNGGSDRIFTVPAAGGTATQVDTGADDNSSDLLPAWSPDGNKLAFTRIESGGLGAGRVRELLERGDITAEQVGEGEFAIHTWVVNLGGSAAPLGGDAAVKPCAFPFGIAEGCQFDLNPAWSPDGQRIAFHRLVIQQPLIISESRLSLRELLAAEGPVDDVDVISSDLSGGETNLTDEGECSSESGGIITAQAPPGVCQDDYKPAHSPDSTRIAFHSDRESPVCEFDSQGPVGPIFDDDDCRPQLFIMNSDGSGVTGPVAPGSDPNTNDPVKNSTDRNADWQRVLPPPPVVTQTPSTPAALRDRRRPRVRIAGVPRACTSSSRLRVPVRINEAVRSVTVTLDGRRIARRRARRFTVTINARRLRAGRHRLRIVAVDRAGNRTTINRAFARCAQARRQAVPHFTG